MPDQSILRHRSASTPNSAWPTLEPGELAVNTYAAEIAVGDRDAATAGRPVVFSGVRPFLATAIYMVDHLVAFQGQVWRCRFDGTTGLWDDGRWEQITGVEFTRGVFRPTPILTDDYTAQPNDWCRVNTTANLLTVVMQSIPPDGSSFRVTDIAGTFAQNPCTIMRNGNLINGVAENYEMREIADAVFLFSAGLGWRVLP